MEIVKILIENPWSTLIVCFGIALVIFAISKLPNPLKLLSEIIQIIFNEIINLGKHKNLLEIINLLSVVLFSMLTILVYFLTKSPSLYNNFLGVISNNSNPDFDLILLIIITLIILIFSPTLIYNKIRLFRINKIVKDLLKD